MFGNHTDLFCHCSDSGFKWDMGYLDGITWDIT